jgi:ABC-2 type transport system ATP-binding protein
MWAYLQELNKRDKTTVFFTTHYMEEADRVAQRIAVIDHGKIIASGTSAALKAQTGAATLEDAFLNLTGRAIRAEEGSAQDRMRAMMRARRR